VKIRQGVLVAVAAATAVSSTALSAPSGVRAATRVESGSSTPPSHQLLDEQRLRSQFGLQADMSYLESLHARARALGMATGDSPYVQHVDPTGQSGLAYRLGALVTTNEAADIDARQRLIGVLKTGMSAGADSVMGYASRHAAEYAGLVIDQPAGTIVTAYFTDNVETHRQALLSLFPYPGHLRVALATYTWDYLNQLTQDVAAALPSLRARGVEVASVGPDPRTNSVVVGLIADLGAAQAKVKALFPAEPLVFVQRSGFHTAGEHQQNAPPARGGQFITHPYNLATSETQCTSAFVFRNGGSYYLATAGHCGNVGEDWYNGDSFFNSAFKYSYGNMASVQFNHDNDTGLISISSSISSNQIFVHQDGCGILSCPPAIYRTVVGWSGTSVGEMVCLAGSTSGGEHCSTISQLNACVDYSSEGGPIVCNQDVAGYSALPGDSGGSWYDPLTSSTGEEQGIESGSDGSTISNFTEIDKAWSVNGVIYSVVN
jgi:hypothetical protein